jgi:hypothetical protein
MAQAQEEAARTVQLAKEKGEQLVSRENLVASAQSKADQLLQAARADAEQIRAEADDYTLDVLSKLEAELVKSLTQARNGIAKIRADRAMPVNGGSA